MTDVARKRHTERCGSCGAEVLASADICPHCGALLAAYRNPLDPADDLVLSVVPVGEKPTPVSSTPAPRPRLFEPAPEPAATYQPPWAPPAPAPKPLVPIPPTSEASLREARARLVRTLAAPERELMTAIVTAVAPPPAAPSPAHGKAVAKPASASMVPVLKQASPRVARVQPAESRVVPAPRKPGFMIKGSVSVVLLWGIGLLLTSCVVFLIASAAAGTSFATVAGVIGLLLGLVGAICVVFAMLVHLVRRESER